MAIDRRMRNRAEEWIAAGMLVLAVGSGWYLVDEEKVTGDPELIEVGWWNIRDLSSSSRDATEIAQIAAALEGMDVVAVGELNDPAALERITQELGSSWEWAATPDKIGRTSGTREHYGFMWDSDALRMVGSVHVDPDPNDDFDREPAWATFEAGDGSLDFTMMAVHITWGDLVGPRKAEIGHLPDVWQRTQAATPHDDDLILVGDFNRKIGCNSFDALLALPGMVRANQDTGPTHISSDTTYDQIFISLDETHEWTGEYGTVLFDEELFGNDDEAANRACSDHRPVWITLYITGEDDD